MTVILVTAATGTVGRRLVPLLHRQLLHGQRVTVRAYDRTAETDPQLAGVDAVFLACPGVPEQVAFETAIVDAAARAGVARVVKLSARGAVLGTPVANWDAHARIERRLVDSGVPAVILRPGFSMANLLGSSEPVRHSGLLPAPAGDVGIAMIDPSDVAACAAVALTESAGVAAGSYELTGGEPVTFPQIADLLSDLLGRAVGYLDLPADQAVSALIRAGLPQTAAEQGAAVFAELRAGAQVETTGDVERLIGRRPRPLRGFLAEHLALFGRDEVTVSA